MQRLCSRVAIIKEGRIIKLEKMSDLTRDNYKKVSVECDASADARFVIDGVSSVERKDGTVTFLFKGDVNVMVRRLAEVQVKNLLIEEPTLEEIFMHYYQKEE